MGSSHASPPSTLHKINCVQKENEDKTNVSRLQQEPGIAENTFDPLSHSTAGIDTCPTIDTKSSSGVVDTSYNTI
jgi:hypothetical protein